MIKPTRAINHKIWISYERFIRPFILRFLLLLLPTLGESVYCAGQNGGVTPELQKIKDSVSACERRKAWSEYMMYEYAEGEEYFKVGGKKNALAVFNDILDKDALLYKADKGRYIFIIRSIRESLVSEGFAYEVAPFCQRILEYTEVATGGKENEEYLVELQRFAAFTDQADLYEYSIPLLRELVEIRKKLPGKHGIDYLNAVGIMAASFHKQGSDDDAIAILKSVIPAAWDTDTGIDKNILYGYANCASTLGVIYKQHNDYPLALRYNLQAKRMQEALYMENSSEYIVTLNALASTYMRMDSLATAATLYDLILKKRDPGSKGMAVSLIDFASFQEKRHDYTGAAATYEKAMAILKNLGDAGYTTNIALNNRAAFYYRIGEYDSAGKYMRMASDAILSTVNESFTDMGESDRLQLLSRYTGNFYGFFSFAKKANAIGRHDYNGWIYDLALVTKGEVLNSVKLIELYARTTTDPDMKKLYGDWMNGRLALEQKTLQLTKRQHDSVQMLVDDKERLLFSRARRARGTGQATDWRAIRDSLKPGECAVEFVKFYDMLDQRPDSQYYAALLIKPGAEQPVWIPLCEERTLKSVMSADSLPVNKAVERIYGGTGAGTAYKIIWAPLAPYLANVKRVYCSTTGLLNDISFAALRDASGRYLMDSGAYQLTRLGTTARLANGDLSMRLSDIRNAALFGDIDYDMPGVTEKGIQRCWQTLSSAQADRGDISALLSGKRITVRDYGGDKATEENFKALGTGGSPALLYVATHGFYFDASIHNDTARTTPGRMFKNSHDPMERGGIVLAGANYAWSLSRSYKNREDGILTAGEFSNIDLHGTRLVILSACQSGQGFVLGEEGRYGLQRAIEYAGAEKMIVALWSIPVRQSSEFMSTFFNQWDNGGDIAQAFRQTQIIMSHKYDPFYWAAFTLIEN